MALNLVSSPGSGKTTLLAATVARLLPQMPVAVIEGDQQTSHDAERIRAAGAPAVQINTGKGCHLDANQVRHGIGGFPLEELDLLFVENVGNLICPVGFDLGQDAKVGMFSVPEGDDKPAKHPYLVLEADLLLLNKTDLLPHVPFDREAFERDVRQVREHVPLLDVSAATGEGLDAWLDWLRAGVREPTGT